MVASALARRVPAEGSGVSNAELPCQHSGGAGRRFHRIIKEGAKEANGTELHREAEAHVITAALANQIEIGVIQVEEAGELFR
jgi:hypothetical protein